MGRKVLITGAGGFLGRHVQLEFASANYKVLSESDDDDMMFLPSSALVDLLNEQQLLDYVDRNAIDSIIHLAATCGGIGINAELPADFIYYNLKMGMNVLEVARKRALEKVVLLGTVCMYPKYAPVPFREDDIWEGFPEETNAPYGIAKKSIMVMGDAYREQHGINVITLIPVNMAGEFDHFEDDRSHVIPALIAKMERARLAEDDEVVLWGDGTASREFLYAGDCAEAIRLAYENYDESLPVNIGTGQEVTIGDLAEKVAQKVGFEGKIVWDADKPNGQPRRCLDVSRAREKLGFEARTSLDDVLDLAIAYYRSENDG